MSLSVIHARRAETALLAAYSVRAIVDSDFKRHNGKRQRRCSAVISTPRHDGCCRSRIDVIFIRNRIVDALLKRDETCFKFSHVSLVNNAIAIVVCSNKCRTRQRIFFKERLEVVVHCEIRKITINGVGVFLRQHTVAIDIATRVRGNELPTENAFIDNRLLRHLGRSVIHERVRGQRLLD